MKVKEGTRQSFGTSQPLKEGPASVERDSFKGGAVQSFGEKVNLNRNSPKADSYGGVSEGTRQSFGEKVNLDRTPRREWDSCPKPASTDRSTK
jgi:hypothetical protein